MQRMGGMGPGDFAGGSGGPSGAGNMMGGGGAGSLAAMGGGVVPDLRYMSADTHAKFAGIVAGAYAQRGMPSFAETLPPQYVGLIHQYLIKRGHDVLAVLNAEEE